MENRLKIGCVIMAAGSAVRFGSNKLATLLDGQSLIRRALEAIPTEMAQQTVVVTQYPEISMLAKEYSFTDIFNEHSEKGISETVKLGLSHLLDCDGVLFQVADQPLLQRETVAALIDFWQQHPDCIAALGHNGQRGNPCLFPARFFPELMALEGDRGGSAVIRRHPEALLLLEADAQQLADADTPEQLDQLHR